MHSSAFLSFWKMELPFMCSDLPVSTFFFRKLRGGSQPILVQASDRSFYVVKLPRNLQGPNLLFNESAGSELYHALRIPTPDWTPLLVTDDFLDRNPGCWFASLKGPVRPHAGLAFASPFLGTGRHPAMDILPQISHALIEDRLNLWVAWIIDVCSHHADNRQALFTETDHATLTCTFIDFGHMFGGPEGLDDPLPAASRYLDWRIYPQMVTEELCKVTNVVKGFNADRLWHRVAHLPEEWKTIPALRAFNHALHCLSSQSFLDDAIQMIVSDLNAKRNRGEPSRYHAAPTPRSVLHSGVRAVA
jgi:hypothetical protein